MLKETSNRKWEHGLQLDVLVRPGWQGCTGAGDKAEIWSVEGIVERTCSGRVVCVRIGVCS